MSELKEKWRKVQVTGHYYRKRKALFKRLLCQNVNEGNIVGVGSSSQDVAQNNNVDSSSSNHTLDVSSDSDSGSDDGENACCLELQSDSENECDRSLTTTALLNAEMNGNLREWTLKHKVTLDSLRDLLKIMNRRNEGSVLSDPSTLLACSSKVIITTSEVGGEKYWHNGLQNCLRQCFGTINGPMCISLNVNIDGLPLFRSSKEEFWPILVNMHEFPNIKPMAIGIYCGKGKPKNLDWFLGPFIEEAKEVMSNGIHINNNKIDVRIRCIICDSPARAYIKGVVNFNGIHGCLKCTTMAKYSDLRKCTYFPHTIAEKRTDEGFRAKTDEEHHKRDSPFLQLPINMVEDVIVADSLHLLDLGVMRRCLTIWREGKITKKCKWSAAHMIEISQWLRLIKMPREFHRAVRGLDEVAYWKGTEYRTFLHYLGPVLLKQYLPHNYYHHFLILFGAATICSSQMYSVHLNQAHNMFINYIEQFKSLYGCALVTSNIHNLVHVVDDVKKFGILSSISSYTFENALFGIKSMLRHGRLPLSQVAKCLQELQQHRITKATPQKLFPTLKYPFGNDRYSQIELQHFLLNNKPTDQWFLTKSNTIVKFNHAICKDGIFYIVGRSLILTDDFFKTPFLSSKLNIYVAGVLEQNKPLTYSLDMIQCKMVAIQCIDNPRFVFFHLLHTIE